MSGYLNEANYLGTDDLSGMELAAPPVPEGVIPVEPESYTILGFTIKKSTAHLLLVLAAAALVIWYLRKNKKRK
jgi:hypothetical protein